MTSADDVATEPIEVPIPTTPTIQAQATPAEEQP